MNKPIDLGHPASINYYRRARHYINMYISGTFGMSLDDLADTCDIAGLAEVIADTLASYDSYDGTRTKDQAAEIASILRSEFTLQDLADNILG